MLGWLEYGRASGDRGYIEMAIDLYGRIRRWIEDPTQLGRPALTGAPRLLSLADTYSLLLMTLELLELDPSNLEYAAVIEECLFRIRLHYTPTRELFLENAPMNEEAATTPEGRLVCPGSIFEINWLLYRALDHIPQPDLLALLPLTLEGALEAGWDREYGGLFYFLDSEDRPPQQLEWSMKLWWVHVEAAYALLIAYERTGDRKWLDWLARVNDWTWKHFPDPQHGEWFGYLDRLGEPALTAKGGAYKGCFHIPRALLFSLQSLERLAAPERS
jgi:N-acylglucosamine 2-epimerase